MAERGGISKVRSLCARRPSDIEIEVIVEEKNTIWQYEIGILQEPRGHRRPILSREVVVKNGKTLLNRLDSDDNIDIELRTQTALEQISENADFRELANIFKKISYLHIVPQIIRKPKLFPWRGKGDDYFGWTLIKNISSTSQKTQKSRLRKIEKALIKIVPQLKELKLTDFDDAGERHLEVRYKHWRKRDAKQNELEFSDGTLRLIGIFWALLEGRGPLLMEEPELYLHPGVIKKLPRLIHRLQKSAGDRQVLISTHSPDLLLKGNGIGPEEILLLKPGEEATDIHALNDIEELKPLIENGFEYSEIVEQYTKPDTIEQLDLFINQL